MSEQKWISISAIGDPWDVEIDAFADPDSRNAYRYRPASIGDGYHIEWKSGRPPTGAHALSRQKN